MIRIVKYGSLIALAVVALVFFLGALGIALDSTFLPWREEVRRETFEQSQAYSQGKITALNRLRQDYARAETDVHRCAMRATALHEASTATELPPDLSEWVDELEATPCER